MANEWNSPTTDKWAKSANPPWSAGVRPKSTEDVTFTSAHSGLCNIEAAAACRGLDANTSTGALSVKAELEIGSTTAAAGNIALRLPASMTVTGTAPVAFPSTFTTTAQQIWLGGHTVEWSSISFPKAGKWILEEGLTSLASSQLKLEAGTLETNGKTVSIGAVSATESSTLSIANSTIKCSGANTGMGWSCAATVTLTATGSTIEVTDTGTNEKIFTGGGKAYATVVVPGNFVKVAGENSFATLRNNTARKPTECKATMTALSNHLVVTAEEANLSPGVEVARAGIPIGTTIVKKIEAGVWEMSANATETAVVAGVVNIYAAGLILEKGKIQTATVYSCNGTESAPARVQSSTAGSAASLNLPADLEVTAYQRTKDLKVEGGVLYLPHGVDLGGNTNIKFEAKPAGASVAVSVSGAPAVASLRTRGALASAVASGAVSVAVISARGALRAVACAGPGGASTVRLRSVALTTACSGVPRSVVGTVAGRLASVVSRGSANVSPASPSGRLVAVVSRGALAVSSVATSARLTAAMTSGSPGGLASAGRGALSVAKVSGAGTTTAAAYREVRVTTAVKGSGRLLVAGGRSISASSMASGGTRVSGATQRALVVSARVSGAPRAVTGRARALSVAVGVAGVPQVLTVRKGSRSISVSGAPTASVVVLVFSQTVQFPTDAPLAGRMARGRGSMPVGRAGRLAP